MVKCKQPECDRRKGRALGLCNAHYTRQLRGKPIDGPIRNVNATDRERFWEKVEKTDSCWLWTGADVMGYGVFRILGKNQVAHRVAYEWQHGKIPDGVQLDHMCHNRSCVNPTHLRFADYSLNGQNRTSANVNSQSGIRGVYWIESRQCWVGSITINRQTIRTDGYSNKHAADRAVRKLRQEHMPYSILDQKEKLS